MFFRNKDKERQSKNADKVSAQERKPAPGTEIRYDPNLVGELKEDHETLLDLYSDIKSAFEAEKFDAIPRKLDDFRSVLQQHLLTEIFALYLSISHVQRR